MTPRVSPAAPAPPRAPRSPRCGIGRLACRVRRGRRRVATTSRKRTFLATESTSAHATRRQRHGQRQPGIAAAAAQVQDRPERRGAVPRAPARRSGCRARAAARRPRGPDGGEVDVLRSRPAAGGLGVDGPQPRRRSGTGRATAGPAPGRPRTPHRARAGRRRRWAAGTRSRGALGDPAPGWDITGEGTRRERRTGAARGRRRRRARGVATPDAGCNAHRRRFGLLPPSRS